MVIAVVELGFDIPMSRSLKARRQALRPVVEQLRSRLRASVAEVGDADLWQRAVLGVALVSNDVRHADSAVASVLRVAEAIQGDAILTTTRSELIHL